MVKRSWVVIVCVVNIFAFQNCTPARFTPVDLESGGQDLPMSTVRTPTSSTALCSAAGAADVRSLKVLFVVDNSTSTSKTDAGKYFRTGSIKNFFETFAENPGFSWGFITFSANTGSYFGSSAEPTFARASEAFRSALEHFDRLEPSGGTNYTAALSAARLAILRDPERESEVLPPYYLVIFMSDGEPYPADPNAAAEVQAIMDVAPGRVSVNTVYFGPHVAENEARLQNMADVGNGRFFDTNVIGTKIDFATAAQLPSKACAQ